MATGNIKGITIEIGGDTTKLSKALSGVNGNCSSLKRELKEVDKLLKLDPTNTELLAQKQTILKDAISNTKEKLDTLKEAEKQVQQQFKNGEVSEEQYRGLEREIEATKIELENLERQAQESNKELAGVSKAAEDTADSVSKIDKATEALDKVSNKAETAAKALAPVSAGAAAVGAASIAAAMDVDEGYDIVTTKTGATGEALEGLKESMDNVFTNVPTDADTAGTAIGEVNTRFGLTGEALESLSEDFIKFAEINDTDLNSSIDNTDTILKKFNVDSSEAGNVLGLLTKTGQDTGLSMDTLYGSLEKNGSTLKEMGLGLTESVNLLASFEKNGVEADVAMAGLKKSVKNYTDQGLSTNEALGKTIDSIKNASTETEALAIAQETFGTKGAAEMAQAIREGKLNVDDLGASLEDYGGVVSTTFTEIQDPWDEAKVALNNLKLAGSELAGSLLTALQPALESIIEAVKNFTSWFKGLTDGQRKLIGIIIMVVAAVAPALAIIGKVVSGITSIISVIKMLQPAITAINAAMAANPAVIVIMAIVALVAALVVLYNKCEWFRNMVDTAFEAIKNVLGVVINAIVGFFQSAWEKIKAIWDFVQPYFSAIWEAIKTVFSVVADVLGSFFSTAWTVIKAVWDVVVAYFEAIWNAIKGIFAVVKAVLSGDFQGAWDAIKSIFSGFANFFQTAWNAVKTIFSAVGSFFSSTFSSAWNAVKNVFSNWAQFFGNLWTIIKDKFSAIGTNIANAISRAVRAGINGVISNIENIINGGIGLINGAIGLINKIPGVNIGGLGYLSLPRLARGGVLQEGGAMVAEAGPELLQMVNGKTIVTPLTPTARNSAMDTVKGNKSGGTINQIELKIERFYNNREQDIRELTEEVLQEAERIKERDEAAYA